MTKMAAEMTISEYIVAMGLTVRSVAQQMGVRKQAIYGYGHGWNINTGTFIKIAKAMTELGVPTTVHDLITALYPKETSDKK